MFTLFVRDSFAAAHRLERYQGKCEALHGHNFTVEALYEGESLDEGGMLVDFALLKKHLREVLAGLDHGYLNDIPFFRDRASSSEYIALYVHEKLTALSGEDHARCVEVRVWESANSCASYRPSP